MMKEVDMSPIKLVLVPKQAMPEYILSGINNYGGSAIIYGTGPGGEINSFKLHAPLTVGQYDEWSEAFDYYENHGIFLPITKKVADLLSGSGEPLTKVPTGAIWRYQDEE